LVELCLDDDTADYHLSERGMQRFEVEDQVEFADILEKAVERLHKDLDEIEESQWRFCRGADDDEVEGGVVAVGYE
jgi:hypothetical protein